MRAFVAITAVAAVVEFLLMFALELTDTLGLDCRRQNLCWVVLLFLTFSWGLILCYAAWGLV